MDVDMMHSQDMEYGLAYLEQAKLLELDYRGDDLKMVVILPNEDSSVAEIESQLDMETLREWQEKVHLQSEELVFPKLEIRTKKTLNEGLIKLGMEKAFGSSADFSGITSDAFLFIETVIHEAWVKIDEGGTEAAAATGVSMATESMPMIIEVNRPFVFLVQDRLTESVLFYGRVMNPAE